MLQHTYLVHADGDEPRVTYITADMIRFIG